MTTSEMLERASYAMKEKKRYGVYEDFMMFRPAGWTYDKAADFLMSVSKRVLSQRLTHKKSL